MQPQPSNPRPPLETLTGTVERVTFRSEDAGFSVLRLKSKGHRDLVTVVGTVPEVRAGEWLEAHGQWTVYNVYGFGYPLGVDSREMIWPGTLPKS